MSKIKLENYPLMYPMQTVIIGANVNEKHNYMVLGNCGIICVKPSVVYISAHKSHYTNIGIIEDKLFSINIPSVEMATKVDYCGLVSGSNIDKSELFEVFYGDNDKIPMIEECPINMKCKVINTFDIYDMNVFIAEVVEAYSDACVLINGFPDAKKVNPLMFSLDSSFWSIGNIVGKAFNDGKSLMSIPK